MLPVKKKKKKEEEKEKEKASIMENEDLHPKFNLKFSSDTISLETFSLRTLWASYFKLYI